MQRIALLLLLLFGCHKLAFACWAEAAGRHGVSPHLLYAIARAESGVNPHAVSCTRIGASLSCDIGAMQINSGNLPALARRGISRADLENLCTNVDVGASILAEKFARYGTSWEGVGAYNASCTELKGADCQRVRAAYAWRVYRFLQAGAGPVPARAQAAPGSRAARGARRAPAVPVHYLFQESLS